MFFNKLNTKDFCVQQCIFRWTVLGVNVWVGERKEAVFLTCICQVQKISMWQKKCCFDCRLSASKTAGHQDPTDERRFEFFNKACKQGSRTEEYFFAGTGIAFQFHLRRI